MVQRMAAEQVQGEACVRARRNLPEEDPESWQKNKKQKNCSGHVLKTTVQKAEPLDHRCQFASKLLLSWGAMECISLESDRGLCSLSS